MNAAMADECIASAQAASAKEADAAQLHAALIGLRAATCCDEAFSALPRAPTLASIPRLERTEERTPAAANNVRLLDEGADVITNVLNAVPNGSTISFSADQLGLLLSAGGPIVPATEAYARVEHLARACHCSFTLDEEAGTGAFTKKFAPEGAIRSGLAHPSDGSEAIDKSVELLRSLTNQFAGTTHDSSPPIATTMAHIVRVALVAIALCGATGAAVIWTVAGPTNSDMPTPRQSRTNFMAHEPPATVASADQPPESDTIGHDQPASHQPIATSPTRAGVASLRVTDPRPAATSLNEPAPELRAPNYRSPHGDSGKNGEADNAGGALSRKASKPKLAARSRPNAAEQAFEPFFRPWWYSWEITAYWHIE
jgi:hypothetical protein